MTRTSILATLVLVLPLIANGADAPAANERVLFLMAEGFNSHEFNVPYEVLRAVGYRIDIAAPSNAVIGKTGMGEVAADMTLDDVKDVSVYAGVFIPGGFSPGHLEKIPKSIEICRAFAGRNLPVMAVCHGPRLLMRAGLMKDRVGTCLPKVADELCDAWRDRAYGKYLDEAAVLDGNIATASHYDHLGAYLPICLRLLEAGRGLPAPKNPAQVVVVTAGAALSKHASWALSEPPRICRTSTTVLADSNSVTKFVEGPKFVPEGIDALVVLPGKDVEALKDHAPFRKLVAELASRKAAIVGVNAAAQTLKTMGFEPQTVTVEKEDYPAYLRSIVRYGQQVATQRGKSPDAAPAYTAAILLRPGFRDREYAALRAWLEYKGNRVAVTAEKKGWVHGKEGIPAEAVLSAGDPMESIGIHFEVSDAKVIARKGDDATTKEAVRCAEAAVAEIDTKGPYDAVIALREGFDDYVFAAMRAYLGVKGRKTAILGPKAGDLQGVNGVTVKVSHAYGAALDLATNCIVVTPGGLWPQKAEARQAVQPPWIEQQAERDAKRVAWIVDRYKGGAVLVTAGMDAVFVGCDPVFAGVALACSAQAGSSFAKGGAVRSGEPALKGKDRIYSARGCAALSELFRLLEQDGVVAK